MTLTPVDILHTEFKSCFKGYNRTQVDEFVHAAADALESALRDKCDLQHKLDQLQEEVDRVRMIESTMAGALTLAQKSADEVKAAAHKQAELILKEAEQGRVKMNVDAQRDAERYRSDVELLQTTRDRFEAEFRAVLGVYQELLDKRKSGDVIHSEVA